MGIRMNIENQISKAMWKLQELETLKKVLRLDHFLFDYMLNKTWYILKSMQSELGLAEQTSIDDLIWIFRRLEEIRMVFDLGDTDYKQLNDLLIEIMMIRRMWNFPEDVSITEILGQVNVEMFHHLGLRTDSLLAKLILFSKLK